MKKVCLFLVFILLFSLGYSMGEEPGITCDEYMQQSAELNKSEPKYPEYTPGDTWETMEAKKAKYYEEYSDWNAKKIALDMKLIKVAAKARGNSASNEITVKPGDTVTIKVEK